MTKLLCFALALSFSLPAIARAEQTGPARRVLAADDSTRRLAIVAPDGSLEWEMKVSAICSFPTRLDEEAGHEAAVDKHHIRDLHATMLHPMGLDYRKLTYFYGGLDQKLTGVVDPEIIKGILT